MRDNAPFLTRVLGRFFGTVSWLLAAFLAVVFVVMVGGIILSPEVSGPIYLAILSGSLIVILLMTIYVGRKLVRIFVEQRRGLIGARMQVRLIGIFAVLAVLPTLVVSIVAIVLLNQGIESWFSQRVTSAMDGSLEVAQAYLKEQQRNLILESRAIAKDPEVRDATLFMDTRSLNKVLTAERQRRFLSDLAVFDSNGGVLGSAVDTPTLSLPSDVMAFFNVPAPNGETYLNYNDGRIFSVVPLRDDVFLVTVRMVEPTLLARMSNTQKAYAEYYEMRSNRNVVRIIFTLLMLVLAVVALACAIWTGLTLAGRIVRPVTELVHAANKVSAGNLDVRVPPQDDDEIGVLTQAFNRMTRQLRENRMLLEKKNHELDDRRRSMEAVLTGVTSAVLSLEPDGTVLLANREARELFEVKAGMKLAHASERLDAALQGFMTDRRELYQDKIRLAVGGMERTFLMRMVPLRLKRGQVQSVVMTLDDISTLLSAQKVAAWADVARRLAHEIKNPLTPIQLSAERLKRKYLKAMPDEDKELFEQLTTTIVRHVEDLRNMLNEFSDFARMPAAKFEDGDVVALIKEEVVLQKEGRSHIHFDTDYKIENAILHMDPSHIRRVVTNIIENAVNAIEERVEKDDVGVIKIVVDMPQDGKLLLSVIDNGKGLPDDVDAEKLFDPYVTTRKKGTGLGLAIVRRVVDQHGGQVRLIKMREGGTCVELAFPLKITTG